MRGPLIPIDDPADDRLIHYRDLNEPASRRRVDAEEAIFVVEGKLAVEQLLRSRYTVRSLLIDDRQEASSADLVDAVRARGMPVYVGGRDVVTATVGFALHRGVVAVVHRPADADAGRILLDAASSSSVGGGPPIVAVLEGLNHHENIGAMFRNAAAFGIAAVLLDPTCADPLYRRSVRVSIGHVLHVPFARLAPWPGACEQLRSTGFLVVALAPHRQSPLWNGRESMSLPQPRRGRRTGHRGAGQDRLVCPNQLRSSLVLRVPVYRLARWRRPTPSPPSPWLMRSTRSTSRRRLPLRSIASPVPKPVVAHKEDRVPTSISAFVTADD